MEMLPSQGIGGLPALSECSVTLSLSLRDREDTKEEMEAEGRGGVEEVGVKCHLGGFLASAVRVKSSLMRQIISFECAGSVITQNNEFE